MTHSRGAQRKSARLPRRASRRPRRLLDGVFGGVLLASSLGTPLLASAADAPSSAIPPASTAAPATPAKPQQPVFYQADRVSYDRDGAMVSLEGHVEIWQGEQVLRADRVTYDRNTGVAAATGNVALVEPDGQVVFADYAELGGGMKNGVLTDMRALLPQNGRLAANGARRTEGDVNELSRVIYTTCNLCAADPSSPPLWDIRARSAVQDVENKKIEYHDAVIDIYGIPVAYFPYFTHPDPTQKRSSGILVPTGGYSSHLGAFFGVPYYWAIDDQQDATITPMLATSTGGGVEAQYRRAFNNGRLVVNASGGNASDGVGGHIFAKGNFAIDDTWRWGFDLKRASSDVYLRDFMLRRDMAGNVLASSIWLEGFGAGSYTRLDARAYQTIVQSSLAYAKIPYALPRWQYSYFGQPDSLGGRFSLDTDAFNLLREKGTNTQRLHISPDWQKPFDGWIGEQWKLTLHADAAAYNASSYNLLPNFGEVTGTQSAQGMTTAALMVRYPLVRDGGWWGTQRLEPIVQLVAAPNGSKYGYTTNANGQVVSTSRIPNEDSLDQELTDANLFALNRFTGVDRLEGGTRVNAGLSGAWDFTGGSSLSGLVGESFRFHKSSPWWQGSGLENRASDIVSRVSYVPSAMMDFTARARFDPHEAMKVNFADVVGTFGPPVLRVNAGYLHSQINPYYAYDYAPSYALTPAYWGATGKVDTSSTQAYPAPRDELTGGISTKAGPWRLSGWARRNLRTHQMASVGADAAYEDECFIFHVTFYKRYTSVAGDNGAEGVLLQLTFKTVGQFGFHAM